MDNIGTLLLLSIGLTVVWFAIVWASPAVAAKAGRRGEELSGSRGAAVLTDMKGMANRDSTDIVSESHRGRVILESGAGVRNASAQ
jgi:hypothetical protein